jgi:hypothetical protein
VGITPEAPDLPTVLAGAAPPSVDIDLPMLGEIQQLLSTSSTERVDAVSVGTPHYSSQQMDRLLQILAGRDCRVPLYVSTSRAVLGQWGAEKRRALESLDNVHVVTDTCTYITPILDRDVEVVMTDSGKWAYYAPANLGIEVVFGSASACVEAAVTGRRAPSW